VGKVFPRAAGRVIAVLICLSALGAVNGLIFTGARISYAMGADHRPFRALGRWHPGFGTPVGALLLQGALAAAIVVLAGSFIDTLLYTAPVVWLFFLGTGISLFVLRRKEPDRPRPYRVIAYPFTAPLFVAVCLFMTWNCLTYAWENKPYALAVVGSALLAGVPAYILCSRRSGVGPGAAVVTGNAGSSPANGPDS